MAAFVAYAGSAFSRNELPDLGEHDVTVTVIGFGEGVIIGMTREEAERLLEDIVNQLNRGL